MKTNKHVSRAICLFLFFTPVALYANNELNTDWLNATIGSSGETLNTEVVQVTQVGDLTIVDVDIPADNLEDYETVVVIGKKSNKPVKLVKQPELLSDDGGPYGIRFQIKRLPGFEFRLRLTDENEDTIR